MPLKDRPAANVIFSLKVHRACRTRERSTKTTQGFLTAVKARKRICKRRKSKAESLEKRVKNGEKFERPAARALGWTEKPAICSPAAAQSEGVASGKSSRRHSR